ncbi:hypothetical protein AGMMS50284_7410 [Clostridia bacterium]|nr:hypothetical protein AGMMS50284_7410 [Clostridia bacterium]
MKKVNLENYMQSTGIKETSVEQLENINGGCVFYISYVSCSGSIKYYIGDNGCIQGCGSGGSYVTSHYDTAVSAAQNDNRYGRIQVWTNAYGVLNYEWS